MTDLNDKTIGNRLDELKRDVAQMGAVVLDLRQYAIENREQVRGLYTEVFRVHSLLEKMDKGIERVKQVVEREPRWLVVAAVLTFLGVIFAFS
jgi:ABC-type multidrug transport system fused ATPase/permease subunit